MKGFKWLEPEEEARLLAACAGSDNEHLLHILIIALESGMRYDEIMSMEWERVDLSRALGRVRSARQAPRAASGQGVAGPEHPDSVGDSGGASEARRLALPRLPASLRLVVHDARWQLLALSKILGHARITMTEKCAHLVAGTERIVDHLLEPQAQQATRILCKW